VNVPLADESANRKMIETLTAPRKPAEPSVPRRTRYAPSSMKASRLTKIQQNFNRTFTLLSDSPRSLTWFPVIDYWGSLTPADKTARLALKRTAPQA
jgi:hypothetical protein